LNIKMLKENAVAKDEVIKLSEKKWVPLDDVLEMEKELRESVGLYKKLFDAKAVFSAMSFIQFIEGILGEKVNG